MARQPKVRVPFATRYRTSRAIFRQSLQALRANRDLWLFPILAAAITIGVMAIVGAVIVYATVRSGPSVSQLEWMRTLGPWAGLLALPVMYPFMVLSTLLNSAMCFALYERMDGRTCTRSEAWRRARSQTGPILRFNLIALLVAGVLQVVGVLLQKLQVVPWLRGIVQMIGGFAWAAASYFVLPILVVERQRSATEALKDSYSLATQQWGKTAAGIVTIGLALMVPMLIITVLFFVASNILVFTMLQSSGGIAAFVTTMVVLVAAFMVAILAVATLAGAAAVAYQTALYRFAKTGKTTDPYTKETLVDAWTPYQVPPT